MNLQEGIAELRKNEKRKFDQSIDLIVNLKGIDMKRDIINAVVTLPHVSKEKKICGFLSKKSEAVTTITPADFPRYKDKKELRRLVKSFDFFVASAPLMPAVATTFGKVLGPAGKMPSPQLGLVMQENETAIKNEVLKISKAFKVRAKEPSIKLSVAKESMSDKDVSENIIAAYNTIVAALPTKKENVRNVMIKLTMSKPIKVEIK
jgi:large subunit ribosomal protein L1